MGGAEKKGIVSVWGRNGENLLAPHHFVQRPEQEISKCIGSVHVSRKYFPIKSAEEKLVGIPPPSKLVSALISTYVGQFVAIIACDNAIIFPSLDLC